MAIVNVKDGKQINYKIEYERETYKKKIQWTSF